MDTLNFDILLRILFAHFLADFIFQPTSWVNRKNERGIKSRYFWLHIAIHLITLSVLLWDPKLWPVILWVTFGHSILDAIKSKFSNSGIWIFLADQLLHVLIIVLVWLIYWQQFQMFSIAASRIVNNEKFWAVSLAYLLLSTPSSVLIGKMTHRWSQDTGISVGNKGLKNAGKWIGIMERLLIFTFIVINEISAIGFLLAAKSVFRFGDLKDPSDHKKTEYIIIGTFISFSIAIAIGLTYKLQLF
jgi:hypothetical protein